MKTFEEVKLLGTKFHKLVLSDFIEYTVESAKLAKKTTISNVNIRGINFAYELPWYKDFINKSDLVFCDGFGVLLGAKLCGCKVNSSHRITCADYIENFAKACEKEGVSLFLLAGKPGIVDKAIIKLKQVAPNLKVQGHHGYFEKSGDENEYVIKQINKFKPDILYVGFGMPLQEYWIKANFAKIDTKVFLPLGACLDFYTDTLYRCPRWVSNVGFEWLSRLLTEPRRLWKRYIIGNPLFFYRLLREQLSIQLRKYFRAMSQD